MESVTALAWPPARLGEALAALAQQCGWRIRQVEIPSGPETHAPSTTAVLGEWLEATATWLGLEAAPVAVPYAALESLLRGAGPALLRLPATAKSGVLVLLGGQRRRVKLLGPDLRVHRVRLATLRMALCRTAEAPLLDEVAQVCAGLKVTGRRRARAQRLLLRARLGTETLDGSWIVRLPAGASFWQQLRQARIPRALLSLLGASLAQYLCWLLAWWVVGQGALHGRLDPAWLGAWGLLFLTLLPLRLWGTWLQGRCALDIGGLLKMRLLAGVLRLAPEEIRHQGAGQFLGRVFEAEAVEALAGSGGLLGLMALLELLLATCVLGFGAGGRLHVSLVLSWLGLAGYLGWQALRQRQSWTLARLTMTHTLIERLVGHRTRLAQEAPSAWHTGEDQELAAYLTLSRRLDRTTALLTALLPRGWLLLGLLGLAQAFMAGQDTGAALALGVGGTLLAYEAYKKLALSLGHLAGAWLAWQQVRPLFHAASRTQLVTAPAATTLPNASLDVSPAPPLLQAKALVFRHQARSSPVLQGCSFHLRMGERLLLEGPSGSGKSTLVALLTGLQRPESGLLWLNGLDLQTHGEAGWRRVVAAAPKFHANHVLTATLAFNLLMGRRWPPEATDLEAAEDVCRALGLGPLLDRMPAGLVQMVGETGWQLSHGERSRLYIARTLLQGAALIILDESFAALDPETLRTVQQCVLARAPTVLVIAHP